MNFGEFQDYLGIQPLNREAEGLGDPRARQDLPPHFVVMRIDAKDLLTRAGCKPIRAYLPHHIVPSRKTNRSHKRVGNGKRSGLARPDAHDTIAQDEPANTILPSDHTSSQSLRYE